MNADKCIKFFLYNYFMYFVSLHLYCVMSDESFFKLQDRPQILLLFCNLWQIWIV